MFNRNENHLHDYSCVVAMNGLRGEEAMENFEYPPCIVCDSLVARPEFR